MGYMNVPSSSSGGDVVDDTSPQLGANLDANANNVDFDDATGIRDSNGNEQLIFQQTTSAVNHFEITNAATTNDPKLSAAGGDTNVGIEIETKGTGDITLDGDVVVETGHTFVSTRLPALALSTNPLNLVEGTHAGRYVIYSGSSGTINLPSSSTAGEHYTILNTTGGNITIGRNGNNINGAASDATVGTYNAVTCIAIGSNNWIALGV